MSSVVCNTCGNQCNALSTCYECGKCFCHVFTDTTCSQRFEQDGFVVPGPTTIPNAIANLISSGMVNIIRDQNDQVLGLSISSAGKALQKLQRLNREEYKSDPSLDEFCNALFP